MNKVIPVLCEGQHDIAFISRILQVNGFTKYNKKLNEFLKPLNDLYINILRTERQISSQKLGYSSQYKVPSEAYIKDNNLVLFHNMGGDQRATERKELLDIYRNLIDFDSLEDEFSDFNFSLRFLFFFDADEVGVEERIKNMSTELNLDTFSNSSIISKGNHEYGCFIFAEPNEENGTLEDLLISLMRVENGNIFTNAKDFLNDNKLDNQRQKEYVSNNFKDSYKGSSKYKELKSIISVSGQLQFSGMNNAVIISRSDYLNRDLLLNDHICKSIAGLFV